MNTPKPDIKISIDVSTKDLAPVAQSFLNKVASAVGVVYDPIKKKRDAAAAIQVVQQFGEIDEASLNPLQQRALNRLLGEEVFNQQNVEKITTDAVEFLDSDSQPEIISDDWLRNFYSKAKFISDSEVQLIWSKILAGEANNPGSFSKRTLSVLFELSTIEAHEFLKLIPFTVKLVAPQPLIFNFEDAIYKDLNFGRLTMLDDAGLINFDSLSGFKRHSLPENFTLDYGDNQILLTAKENSQKELELGMCIFTEAGLELYNTLTQEYKPEFAEYLAKMWTDKNYTASVINEPNSK